MRRPAAPIIEEESFAFRICRDAIAGQRASISVSLPPVSSVHNLVDVEARWRSRLLKVPQAHSVCGLYAWSKSVTAEDSRSL